MINKPTSKHSTFTYQSLYISRQTKYFIWKKISYWRWNFSKIVIGYFIWSSLQWCNSKNDHALCIVGNKQNNTIYSFIEWQWTKKRQWSWKCYIWQFPNGQNKIKQQIRAIYLKPRVKKIHSGSSKLSHINRNMFWRQVL